MATNKNNSVENGLELKHFESNISMITSDIDKLNPYGINYIKLPYASKLCYKWIRMQKYVHFTKEQHSRTIEDNSKFYGGIFLTGICTFGLSYQFKKKIITPYFPKIDQYLFGIDYILHGIFVSFATTHAYGELYGQYVRNKVPNYIEEYKQEAIRNGFEDYAISEDGEINNSWYVFQQFNK